jgi:peptide methionine sulfoxide reductase msrA/msrB
MKELKFKPLTLEEERVIVHKGTERPFTGKYDKFYEEGTYACKRCGAALYESDSKFNSGCGWPSFDDEIEGAVKRVPDADGRRTEIICNACGGHLGHVFMGEGFTEKDTRHCVNSISLEFIPAGTETSKTETAYFAGGCFWGVEYYLQQEPGVISTDVGYMGGKTQNPTYKEVCYKSTGHAEVVKVVFDPATVSFEKLAKLFFEIHDPTQYNRQGPDVGDQYRSEVFYANENQKEITNRLIKELKSKGYRVVTEVSKAKEFWRGENYHQDYYKGNGHEPYCHARTKRF